MSSLYINSAKDFIREKISPLLNDNEDLKITSDEQTFFTKVDHCPETAKITEIASQIKEDLKNNSNISIYIHFPVCNYTCGFCHYPQQTGTVPLINESITQLVHEISIFLQMYPELKEKNISSFCIGGGTPSLMNEEQLKQLFETFSDYKFFDGCEKTIEGTPDSLNENKIKSIIDLGFNRVSIGIQTLDDKKLSYYKRGHSRMQSIEALDTLLKESHINTNIDLIYGFPKQSIEEFLEDIETIIGIGKGPSSLTLYRLRLNRFGDKETAIMKEYERNHTIFPTQEEIYAMKLAATLLLKDKGYIEEPIGWFHKTDESIEVYKDRWLTQIPLYGFGWKAYSYSQNIEFTNTGDLEKYRDSISSGKSPINDYEIFDDEYRIKKKLAFLMKYGKDFEWNIKNNTSKIIDLLIQMGVIQIREKDSKRIISITEVGRILLEEIITSYIFEKQHPVHSNILNELL